jgi:multidrug resistance efflux pump
MEKLYRSRAARGAFAAVLILIGVWGFAPYVLHDVGTSAYVNADLTRVATPVAGVLTGRLPKEGSYLSRDEHLQLVSARTPDRSRLDELEQQTALAQSSVGLVESQLAEIRQADGTLSQRSGLFQEATLKNLDSRLRQAQAELDGCAARQREQQDKLTRARRLADQGFVSEAGLRSAEDAFESARESCNGSRAGLDALRAQADAARRGVYLSDGSNDAPYAEQQRGRLMLRRQELMTELVRGRAALSQLQDQLAQERGRYQRAAAYETVLPAEHLIWNVAARPGSEVGEGQALMDLADCRNRFLVVELPARRIEHLTVGDAARVRLLGSGQWVTGHVRRITGGAAKQDNRLFAADVPRPGPHSFTVEVSLEAPAPGGSRSCDIGRMADVRFGGPLIGASSAKVAATDGAGPF